jgi:hypothetical protein
MGEGLFSPAQRFWTAMDPRSRAKRPIGRKYVGSWRSSDATGCGRGIAREGQVNLERGWRPQGAISIGRRHSSGPPEDQRDSDQKHYDRPPRNSAPHWRPDRSRERPPPAGSRTPAARPCRGVRTRSGVDDSRPLGVRIRVSRVPLRSVPSGGPSVSPNEALTQPQTFRRGFRMSFASPFPAP